MVKDVCTIDNSSWEMEVFRNEDHIKQIVNTLDDR